MLYSRIRGMTVGLALGLALAGMPALAESTLAGNWVSERGEALHLESGGRFDFAGDGGFYEVRGENIVFYYDASGLPDEMPYTVSAQELVIGKGSRAERFNRESQ